MAPHAGFSQLLLLSICNVLFMRRNEKKEDSGESDHHDSLLCRFVVDGHGKQIGESVTIDDDLLIIKAKGRFLGIPLKHVEETEDGLLVKGLIDFKKAYDLGETWRKECFKDPAQTEDSSGG